MNIIHPTHIYVAIYTDCILSLHSRDPAPDLFYISVLKKTYSLPGTKITYEFN